MTLDDFRSKIENKYFIEIVSIENVLEFTNHNELGIALRNEATNKGVIVFLKTINRIFVRGTYYGCDPNIVESLQSSISSLSSSVESLNTNLSNLSSVVDNHYEELENNVSLIQTNIQNISNLTDRLVKIENDIATLLDGSNDLSEAIIKIIDERIDEILDSKVSSLGYIKNNDQILTNLQNQLNEKVAQNDFTTLLNLIGDGWTPKHNNKTVIEVINELEDTSQTLTVNYQNLSSAISGIPKFEIMVVKELPTMNISRSTIYLLLSPDEEQDIEGEIPKGHELFTEYIYINLDANKVDPETQLPLPERMGWEKLGRQIFKMSQYMDKDTINEILTPIIQYIDSIKDSVDASKMAQVELNKTNIEELQTKILNIENALSYLLDNGIFKLTGEDIKTSKATNSNTIFQDIELLKANKLNIEALDWKILDNE